MAVRPVNGRASWGKTYAGFSVALAEAGKTMTKQGATMMLRACERWLIEENSQWPRGEGGKSYKSGYHGGDHYYPWYTGNLHDSVATVISDRNKTLGVRYMPDCSASNASVLQNYKGQVVDGEAWGKIAAQRSSHVLLPGLQARLVIGVPYAKDVDEMPTHAGYIAEFEKSFSSEIRGEMEKMRNLVIRTK